MKNLLLLILLAIPSYLWAQTNTIDVVELNNGSVIKGAILEIVPGEKVKILTKCDNTWVFDMKDVARISKENAPSDKKQRFPESSQGYFNLTSIGVLAGPKTNQQIAPFSLETINGYRFKDKCRLGLGLGLEFHGDTYVPILIDGRVGLGKSQISPYFYAQAGYSLPMKKEKENGYNGMTLQGGALYSAGFGVEIHLNPMNSINLSLGWREQVLNSEEKLWDGKVNIYKDIIDRLAIRFGFYFN
jgi:hypothetical protein